MGFYNTGGAIADLSQIVSTTKPTTRDDGSALETGDRWYKDDDGSGWFWNGTYWLSQQVYGPRGSFTFIGASENFSTTNDGLGIVYGAFVEKFVIRYRAKTTDHDASNYRNFDFVFRGARNQADEFELDTGTFDLDGTDHTFPSPIGTTENIPLPTTSYTTLELPVNTYAGARGDIIVVTASSAIVAGSPDSLQASFHLFVRAVAP